MSNLNRETENADAEESEAQPESQSEEQVSFEMKLECNDIETLRTYIAEEKIQAVTLKRAGDKESALLCVKNYKKLQLKLDSIVATPLSSENANQSSSVAISKEIPHESQAKDDEHFEESKRDGRESTFRQRVNDFKKLCLLEKRSGNLEKAREFLSIARTIELEIENRTFAFLPDLPKTQPQTGGLSTKTVILIESAPETADMKLINSVDMKKCLTDQIEKCNPISALFLQSKDKPNALKFHQRKKKCIAQLELLTSSPVPYYEETVEYMKIKWFEELEESDFIVEILSLIDLEKCSGFDPAASTYISINFPWTISEAIELKSDSKSNITFKPYHFIIERSKRFIRFIEKKKITFQVFQKKGILMKRPTIYGQLSIPLVSFNKLCEVKGVFECMNERRRPNGVKMEIRMRLRSPIQGQEVITIKEKWKYLADENEATFKSDLALTPEQGSPSNKQPVLSSTESTPKVDYDEEFYDDEIWISNLVLEKELELINAEIVRAKAEKRTISEDLVERKESWTLKRSMLETQVETGQLQISEYIDMLKKAMTKEKQRALRFKEGNRLDLAKKTVYRIKLMKQELSELE